MPELNTDETLVFELTANDGEGGVTTASLTVDGKPHQLDTFEFPLEVGKGCAFNAYPNSSKYILIDYTLDILNIDNAIIETYQGANDLAEQDIVLDYAGGAMYRLNGVYAFTNNRGEPVTANISMNYGFDVHPAFPTSLTGQDYTIESGTNVYLCDNVVVYDDITLTIEPGVKVESLTGEMFRFVMFGDVVISGTELERVSFKNVGFVSNQASLVIHYADFDGLGSVVAPEMELKHSTFANQVSFRGYQEVSGNEFKGGVVFANYHGEFVKNTLSCDGVEQCLYVTAYSAPYPLISYNEIMNAGENTVFYNLSSFVHGDVDLRKNYWGGLTVNQVERVIFDSADNDSDKTRAFIYDPMFTTKDELLAEPVFNEE